MPALTPPTSIDFTSRDWAGLVNSMLDYATVVAPEWTAAQTQDSSDMGVVLIESFAYMGDVLNYYIDRVASESFLSTAQLRSSVLAHAALLDYTPRSATAATTLLSFTVSPTPDIVIPAGFQVSSAPDGISTPVVFETDVDLVIPANDAPQTFQTTATEGKVVTDEVVATSTGGLDLQYALLQTPVVASALVVRVVETPDDPGVVWLPVTSLLDSGPNDNSYAVSIDAAGALTIFFGDNVNGRIPPIGSVIHASYRIGGGADGNVPAGTLTYVVNPSDVIFGTLDAYGNPVLESAGSVPEIEVANQQPGVGGSDAESLVSIRTNAPRSLKAHDRAITLADYEALALSVPQVLIAKASAVASVYTNVAVYVAMSGATQPSQDTLSAVVRYLNERKLVNVSVVAAGAAFVPVNVSVEVNVDPHYSQAQVVSAVNSAVQSLLAFDNVDFETRISLSEVYTVAAQVQGVTGVIILALNRDVVPTATTADVVTRANEIPVAGVLDITGLGGITTSPGSLGDIIGTGAQVQPSAAGAPVLSLIRCDPNSTHVELVWNASTNTTAWDVLVVYYNGSGVAIQSTTVGPFTTPAAILDLPLIGAGRAATVTFTVESYNGSIGPVLSPNTSTTYSCES